MPSLNMNAKQILAVLLLVGASTLFASAQQAKAVQPLLQSAPSQKKPDDKVMVITTPKLTKGLLAPRGQFGGYFMEFLHAQSKATLLDLKTPIDPVKDSRNLSFYPRSPQVQAVIFFSIRH
jgi:hypothetical protein